MKRIIYISFLLLITSCNSQDKKDINEILNKPQPQTGIINTSKESLSNHVIVCGYGGFGKQIIYNLKKEVRTLKKELDRLNEQNNPAQN